MRKRFISPIFFIIICLSLFPNKVLLSCDPVTINGPTVVCPNSTNTYTVTGIDPSQINFWSIGLAPGSPPPLIVCGFTNSPPGVFNLCLASGTALLCINYDNGCEECIEILVSDGDPLDDIIGDITVCGGDTETYTLSPPVTGINVNYTVTNGTIISSNNSEVVVQWDSNETEGEICATAEFCNDSQTICISVDILPIPIGSPITLSACGDGLLGEATFDLTDLNATLGGGLPISWFEDIGLSIPITNPSNYQTSGTIIYGIISNGTCFSSPIPVTINVFPINPLYYGMEIVEDNICATNGDDFMPITIFFAVPFSGTYDYEYELVCENGTTTGIISSSNNPITLQVNSSCTFRILSITSASSGCQATFSPPLSDSFTFTPEQQVSTLPGFENICLGQSLDLNNYLSYSNGTVTWYSSFPPDPVNLLPSSVITPTVSNTYSASISYQGCVYNVAFPITVTPAAPPFILNQNICVDAGNINLNQFLTPPNLQGVWSGQGVTGNNFNPLGLTGEVPIIFNPNNACYENGTVTFQVIAPQTITLSDSQICQSADSFDLNTLLGALSVSGIWSGSGVIGNTFYPSNFSGNINIAFDPSIGCINSDTAIINVIPSIIPINDDAQICNTTASLNLFSLQDTLYPIGLWSGPGIINNVFYTTGLTDTIELTFTAQNACAIPVQSTIIIKTPKAPILESINICQSASPLDLFSLVDSLFPTGTWSGINVDTNVFNPAGLLDTIILTFNSDQACTLPSTAPIVVLGSPLIENLAVVCQNDDNNYTVSFDISGGDSTTYIVNGTMIDTSFYISTYLSNEPFNIILGDMNACSVDTIEGIKNCACTSDAGSMDFSNAPLKSCSSDSIRAIFNIDSNTDTDYVTRFILHDEPGITLGNILAISSRPIFAFPTSGVLGMIYYISPIVTSIINNGELNLNDPCLSVAPGVPIQFYEPNTDILPVGDFCITDCIDIPIKITGESPFSYDFEVINDNNILIKDNLNSLNQDNAITFCPENFNINTDEKLVLRIVQVNDKNCSVPSQSEISFNVNPQRKELIDSDLCEGDTLIINGITYDASNNKGQQIIPSTNIFDCDSIIDIDLNILLPTSSIIDRQICNDQSIIINGNVYDKNRPSGIEITTNQIGCDSVITIDLQILPFINTNLNQILCIGDSIVVNGNTYDINKPSGQELITSNVSSTCDTMVNINLSFIPESLHKITDTICYEENIEINGAIFGSNMTNASFTFPNGATNGCDSILLVEITFYPTMVDTIKLSFAAGESREINGVVFDKNKLTGLTQSSSVTQNGCLKYEYIIITFDENEISASYTTQDQSCPDTYDGAITITSILGCKNYKIQVNGNVYQNITIPFTINNLPPNTYNLEIFGDENCYYKSTFIINESLSKGFDLVNNEFEKNVGINTILALEVSPLPNTIQWLPNSNLSCDDCLSPILYDINEDTKLQLLLTDSFGCIFIKEVFIDVITSTSEIAFPNIFSPNGDGVNDLFTIRDTPSQKIDRFAIYDRWGNLVYMNKREDKALESISWDGNLNNQDIIQGVYVYVATIALANGQQKIVNGNFVLIK
ncbi:MAG TPA: gliding motility-associated C-terminal domain-containing protein [Saprospiraceae bacterium]|nr:gliding motility-associated C-terminal domain-containing protein [Saprospiraceae bacterium]